MQNSPMQVTSKKMFGLNGLFSKLGKSKIVNTSDGFAAFFNSLISNLKSVDSEKQTVSSSFFEKSNLNGLKENSKPNEFALPNFPFLSENPDTADFRDISLPNDNSSGLNFLNSTNPAELNESQPKILSNKKTTINTPVLKQKTLSTFKSFLMEIESSSAQKPGNNRMIAKLLQEPVEVQKTVYTILKEIAHLSEAQLKPVKITEQKMAPEEPTKIHLRSANKNGKLEPENSLIQNIKVNQNSSETSKITIEGKSEQNNILIEIKNNEVTIKAQKGLKKTLNKASAYLKNFVRHDFTLQGKTDLNNIESSEKKISPSMVTGVSKSTPGFQKNAPVEKLGVKNLIETVQQNTGKVKESINDITVKNNSNAKFISRDNESELAKSFVAEKKLKNITGVATDKKNVKNNIDNLAATKNNYGKLDVSNNLTEEKNSLGKIQTKTVKPDPLNKSHLIKNNDGVSKIFNKNSNEKIIVKNDLLDDEGSFKKLNSKSLRKELIEKNTIKNTLNTVSRHNNKKNSELEPGVSEKTVSMKIKTETNSVETLSPKSEKNNIKSVKENNRAINVTQQHKPDSVRDQFVADGIKKVPVAQELKESLASSLKSFSAEKEKPVLEIDKSTPEKANNEHVAKEESIDYNVNKNLKIKFVFTNEMVKSIPKTTVKRHVQSKVERRSLQGFQNKNITLNDVLKQGVQSSKIQNQVELNPPKVAADQSNFINDLAALKIKETINRKNQNNPKKIDKISGGKMDDSTEKTVFNSHKILINNVSKSPLKINDNFSFPNEQSAYKINVSPLDEAGLIDFNKLKTPGPEETTSSTKSEEFVLNTNNHSSKIVTGISPKMVTPVKYLSEVIQKFYDTGSQTFTQSQVVVDGGDMGKLDIRLNKNATTQSILILVENETIKTEMARILPHLAESLQTKGVQLNSVNIDVGQAWDKNNKRQNGRNNPKTKFTQTMEGTNEQDTTINSKRYYGYNTMDIIA